MLGEIASAISIYDRVSNLLKRLFRGSSGGVEETVAGRFVRLFESHGVHRNQIPRFFGHGLTVVDAKDDDTLLPKLSEELLDAACELFAVRREWLDGAEKQVHTEHDFYKHPEGFVEFADRLVANNADATLTGVLVVPQQQTHEPIGLFVIEEPIGWIGDRQIVRFHLCNNWLFSYWKSRAYLTACMAIAWKRNIYIHGRTAPVEYLEKVSSGEVLLGGAEPGIHHTGGKRWHPDGMCLDPEKFLNGIDPERGNFGFRAGLDLWLDLEERGYMDSGFGKSRREAFEKKLADLD